MAPAVETGDGVPDGPILLEFTAAAHRGDPELPAARRALLAAVGSAGLLEVCLTVAAFNGLTRVADATGIPLDGGTLAATIDVRADARAQRHGRGAELGCRCPHERSVAAPRHRPRPLRRVTGRPVRRDRMPASMDGGTARAGLPVGQS